MMCDQHSTTRVRTHEGGVVGVDPCIAPLVEIINAAGIQTVASCCGHGWRPGNIALRDGREMMVARNYWEARFIDGCLPIDINGVGPEEREAQARAAYEQYKKEN